MNLLYRLFLDFQSDLLINQVETVCNFSANIGHATKGVSGVLYQFY